MRVRVALAVAVVVASLGACSDDGSNDAAGSNGSEAATEVPTSISEVMGLPRFAGATWGIYAIDLETGEAVVDVNSNTLMMMGSNAKIFSVGSALDVFGPDHTFVTPVYAVGPLDGETLTGDLVLVASGDLVMGGRGGPRARYRSLRETTTTPTRCRSVT